MNYFELIILGLTLFFILNGALWGFIRGRNRSILRISIVIGVLIICFILKNPIVDAIFDIEISGQTIGESLIEAMGDELAGLGDMLIALVKGILGFLIFIIMFVVLKFITLIILYPILKIFVKKEGQIDENDNPYDNQNQNPYNNGQVQYVNQPPVSYKTKFKLQRGFGALIGALQGLVICIFIIGPIVCVLSTASTVVGMVDSISDSTGNDEISYQDDKEEIILLDNSIETGDEDSTNIWLKFLLDFNDCTISKVYKVSSGWVYDGITKSTYTLVVTDEDGKENKVIVSVSLDSVGEIIEVASTVVTEFADLTELIEELEKSAEADTINSELLEKLGNSLINIGNSLNGLSKDSKSLLDNIGSMIIDMIMEESDSEDANEEMTFLYDFKFSELDLTSIGEALVDFAPYITEEKDFEDLTDEELDNLVDKIVNCMIQNISFLDLLFANIGEDDISLDVGEEYYSYFKESIDKHAKDQETKEKLYDLFGIEN